MLGVVAVVGLAVVGGVVAAAAVIFLSSAVLPPFNDDVDEDTMREFVPVALAYLTWAVTTFGILILALRRFLREDPPRD